MTEKVLRDVSSEREIEVLRTDAVIAKEYREQLGPILDQLCAIASKARTEGYEIAWVMQPDSFGRNMRCTEITIKKQL